MASVDAWSELRHGSSRLSQEIFSILESRFLFGASSPRGAGRVRVLSIDGGGADGGMLAAVALSHLESRIRSVTGNSCAQVVDFFDLAAGSGAGAFIAAALFALRLSVEEVVALVAKNRKCLAGEKRRTIFGRSPGGAFFRRLFYGLTVKDAAKPLLVPCYDAATAAPFVFSRADAVEADMYDFPLWKVCAAACGAADKDVVVSVDGRTSIFPVGGSAAVANPTAVAVTHVLNNKREFPFADSLNDIFVLSIGAAGAGAGSSAADVTLVASACQADIVDQSVAMAFGGSLESNYIRIQLTAAAALEERGMKSVLFKRREIAKRNNGELLDAAACAIVEEHERRQRSKIPTVMIKPPSPTPTPTPRSSSSSASTLITVSTTVASDSS